nr:integrase arm-type DNA-binding domain-containing protein [Vibrio cholerae]
MKPLSPTQVTKAKPLEKEYSLANGNGLYLRIKPNGAKLWIFNYIHPVTKKRKNIALVLFLRLLSHLRERKQEKCTNMSLKALITL